MYSEHYVDKGTDKSTTFEIAIKARLAISHHQAPKSSTAGIARQRNHYLWGEGEQIFGRNTRFNLDERLPD